MAKRFADGAGSFPVQRRRGKVQISENDLLNAEEVLDSWKLHFGDARMPIKKPCKSITRLLSL